MKLSNPDKNSEKLSKDMGSASSEIADARESEYKRIRGSFLLALIGYAHFLLGISLLVAVIASLERPGDSRGWGGLLQVWLQAMPEVAKHLESKGDPVATSLSVAGVAVALVLACSFSRRPDAEMVPVEVVRLRFLEKVTGAFCNLGGLLLVSSAVILMFGGREAAVGAVVALGCGLCVASLSALIPVPFNYWQDAITRERDSLSRIQNSRPIQKPRRANEARNPWLRFLFISGALRLAWISSYLFALLLARVQFSNVPRLIAVVIAGTLVLAAIWDAPISWSFLQLGVIRLTDRGAAIVHGALLAFGFMAIFLGFLQVSLTAHWSIGVFLAGCMISPFMAARLPRLSRNWRDLRSARFERAVKEAQGNIERYVKYRQLADTEPLRPKVVDGGDVAGNEIRCALRGPSSKVIVSIELRRHVRNRRF